VLHYTRLETLARDTQSSLLDPFIKGGRIIYHINTTSFSS
jgi:hypothetical protein